MDDLIESFISSPTWSDANASIWSSSFGNTVPQSDFLLTDPEESNGENGGNPPRYMISSSCKLSDTYSEDFGSDELDGTSSLFINGDLRYDINKGLFPSETICQHKLHKEIMEPQVPYGETPQSSFTLQGAIACNLTSQSFGKVLNVPYSTVLPHSALAMSSSAESDDSKQSGFPSTSDAHSFSSASAIWNLSYLNASSLIRERKSQVFAFPRIESDGTLRAICSDNVNIQMDNSPSASDYNKFQKNHLPSFTSEGQVNLTSDRMRTHQQWPSESIERNTEKHHISHSSGTQSQFVLTNGNESNGTAKPRIRARRGQATDPHSIAERLRREKITERMKNLQELVPSSNKTDKASMLDEIIDYVKFLQLQVKVLSMSRLGATGAVVPLLTDSQTEGSRNQLLSSSSVVQGGVGLSHSQDNLAFEQEIVKLMESNLTTAMQHLQNKGLCLMPVALATAISKQKGSSSAAIPPERRKPDAEHCVSSQCSQSYMEKNVSDDGAKKEEASKSINKVRELKTQGIKAN